MSPSPLWSINTKNKIKFLLFSMNYSGTGSLRGGGCNNHPRFRTTIEGFSPPCLWGKSSHPRGLNGTITTGIPSLADTNWCSYSKTMLFLVVNCWKFCLNCGPSLSPKLQPLVSLHCSLQHLHCVGFEGGVELVPHRIDSNLEKSL